MKHHIVVIMLILIVITTIGCQSESAESAVADTAESAQLNISTATLPATLKPTETATATSTATPTATATSTPSPTATNTTTPTATATNTATATSTPIPPQAFVVQLRSGYKGDNYNAIIAGHEVTMFDIEDGADEVIATLETLLDPAKEYYFYFGPVEISSSRNVPIVGYPGGRAEAISVEEILYQKRNEAEFPCYFSDGTLAKGLVRDFYCTLYNPLVSGPTKKNLVLVIILEKPN